MQDVTAILITGLGVPIAGAVIYYFTKAVQATTTISTTVVKTSENVDKLLNNHLPHIYDRLGHIEGKLEIG